MQVLTDDGASIAVLVIVPTYAAVERFKIGYGLNIDQYRTCTAGQEAKQGIETMQEAIDSVDIGYAAASLIGGLDSNETISMLRAL